MFSIETIVALNKDAARKARSSRKRPKRIAAVEELTPRSIPHLGYACEDIDEKHRRLETLFVDSSGWGAPGEAALTQDQFKAKLGQLIGEHGPVLLAIEEAGQFQANVAVWSARKKAKSA